LPKHISIISWLVIWSLSVNQRKCCSIISSLSVNQRKWMLDSWSTHDYEQNLALDCMKTCLACDLCLLGFGLNVHRVLDVFDVWSVFVKKNMFLFFFLILICLWFNCLFCFSFRSNHDFWFSSKLNQYF
jgi:hypothetical protein